MVEPVKMGLEFFSTESTIVHTLQHFIRNQLITYLLNEEN